MVQPVTDVGDDAIDVEDREAAFVHEPKFTVGARRTV